MTKYFKLLRSIFRYNLIRELEFKANFIIRCATQCLFVALQIFIVSIFFNYTDQIGSWTKSEVFLLVGVFRIIEGAFHIFVHSNLLYLPELINSGELDILLAKPINSLFMISLKRTQFYEITTLLSGVIIIFVSHQLNGIGWILLPPLVLFGFIALYSLILIFACISFHTSRLTALSSFWDVVSKTLRFPLNVFTNGSRLAEMLIVPFAVVVTIPAQLLIHKQPTTAYLSQMLICPVLFLLANYIWTTSLRRYSSASS